MVVVCRSTTMAVRRLVAAAAVVVFSCLVIPAAVANQTDVTQVSSVTKTASATTTTTTTTTATTTTAATTTSRGRYSTEQETHHPPVHTSHQQHPSDHGVTGHTVDHHTGPDHTYHNLTHDDNHTGGHSHVIKCPPEGEEDERYAVAKFDFDYVATPLIVTLWVLFVSLAKIAFHSCELLEKYIPESCLLIIIGVIVGIITFFASDSHQLIEFDTQMFFLVILPPIIMDAGYFMPTRAFFDQLGTILLHAIIATLSNTFLIGLTLWGIGRSGVFGDEVCLPILHALVFASLLAAVDPVAVLAVFESIHVNQLLYIIVFGESLLNDGVAVVLYHMFKEMSIIGHENVIAVDIILGIVSFLVVVFGSIGIGTLLGLAGAFTCRFTHHLRIIEPLIVVSVPYLSFLMAEIFHLSGILSCTACGIAMRKYVEANISDKSKITVRYVMKMMASVAEAVIFMLLGTSVVSRAHVWNTEFVLLTLLFCLVYRAVVVVVLNFIANYIRAVKLDGISQFVMAYGGLRGAIAFSLAVILEKHAFPSRQLFITTTIVVVYFTNLVLGTTMQPLVKALRVKTQQKIEITMSHTIGERVLDHVMVGVEAISEERGHHHIREGFLMIDYYLRPIITGKERPDKIHRPGRAILKVYNQLTEEDAMALTKMPSTREAMMRWNASLKNIASMVRNHTTGNLQAYVRKASDAGDQTRDDVGPEKATSSRYNTTLAPLTPEMIVSRDDDNTLPGNQLPLNPPGVTPSRSFTNLQATGSDTGTRLRRTASNKSGQRPTSFATPDSLNDHKTNARQLRADGANMRDKEDLSQRRFRPGWMQNTEDGGVDNPAMTDDAIPSASFSVGDPEEVNPAVIIAVTDFDNKKSTSAV